MSTVLAPAVPNIPPPEPDLTPGEMVRRAESMRADLRKRQETCENLGRLPDETHADFLNAGFYRIVQPRRFGGYEFSLRDFSRLLVEVARGCSDSAWVLSMIAARPVAFLCLFPPLAQCEAYGNTGDCRASIAVVPSGTAVPCDGGYRVQGVWDYCTGCDVSTHLLGHSFILDPETRRRCGTGYVLFERSQFRITDNWNMIGMQGTGSRRVTVDEMYIPAHRVLPLSDAQWQSIGEHPGRVLYTNPLYHGFPLAPFEFSITSVIVGCAFGALDVYETILWHKPWLMPPYPPRFEMPEYQRSFGEAQALIDTADAALSTLTERYGEACRLAYEQKREFTTVMARKINRACEQCVELSWQAVDLLFRTAGSSSATKSATLGRYFRNIAVLRTHIGTQRDHTSINVGRLHFGLPALSGS